jgi:hypothetical protein
LKNQNQTNAKKDPKMKTYSRQQFLTSAVLGLACWMFAVSTASAQLVGAAGGRKTTRLHDVTLSPETAARGERARISARLEWSDIGHGWKPLAGKPVVCDVDVKTTDTEWERTKITAADGTVTFRYRVPTDLPAGTKKIFVRLSFEGDAFFKPYSVTKLIMVKP